MSASNKQFDLVHDLQVQLKWQPSFAQAAKDEYIRWLRLRADAGDFVSCKLPPSRVVAMVWNIHRQWTLDYENTCQAIGGYIHHYPPAMRMDIEWEQAYAATVHNYKQIYKQDPPSAYWGPPICPYKPIGEDDNPPKDSKNNHSTGRRASTKRESARNHSNTKVNTRQSEVTTRRSADITTSTPSAQKDRTNNNTIVSSRRKSIKIIKTPLASNTRDAATDNDSPRNGAKRRRFPGSSPHFVLKPLAPGEKRKRGRPSFSDYILADDGAASTPPPKKKDIKAGASEKLLSPRTPVSTRSLGRRRSSTSIRAAASITKKEKSKPMRRLARASNATPPTQASKGSASRNKNQVTDNDEIDVASTLPKDVVLEHVVKRPRGRPRKDGSWPTQRTSRKNDSAAKAAIARAAVSKLVSSKSAASKATTANESGAEHSKATSSEAGAPKSMSNPLKISTGPSQPKASTSAKKDDEVTVAKEVTGKKGDTVVSPLSEPPSTERSSALPGVTQSTPAINEKSVPKSQPATDAPAKDAASATIASAATVAISSAPAPAARMSITPVTAPPIATRTSLPVAPVTTLPPVAASGSTPNQVANNAPVSGPNSKDVIMADVPPTGVNSSQSPGKAIDTSDIRMQDLSDKDQAKAPNTSDHSSRDPVFDQIIDDASLGGKDRSADIASGLIQKNVQSGQDVVFPQPGGINNSVEMDISLNAVQRSEALPAVAGAPGTMGAPPHPGTDKLLPQVRGFPMGGMTVNAMNQPNPVTNSMEGGLLPVAPGGLLSKPDGDVPKEGITGPVGNAELRPQIKRPRGRPRKEAAWPSNRPKTIGEDGVERPKDVNDPSQALNFPMGPSGTV